MYFNNTQLLQNTLLPYFCNEYPLISINKQFSKLNYEKYNTHLQPHDIIETYYPKTQRIKKRETYKNGKCHGLQEIWYDIRSDEIEGSSNIHRTRHYCRNGLYHGLYEEWYASGQLKEKSWHKDGGDDGLYESWYENGKLAETYTCKHDGLDGVYKSWWSNGNIKLKCNYVDGKLDGSYNEYYENGRPWLKCKYNNGNVHGLYEYWHKNGNYQKSKYDNGTYIK